MDASTWVALLGALVAVIGAGAAITQAVAAHRSAGEAADQVAAARLQAEAAVRSAQAAEAAIGEAQRQAEASERSAAAAERANVIAEAATAPRGVRWVVTRSDGDAYDLVNIGNEAAFMVDVVPDPGLEMDEDADMAVVMPGEGARLRIREGDGVQTSEVTVVWRTKEPPACFDEMPRSQDVPVQPPE